MTTRPTDISALTALIDGAETAVSDAQDAVSDAAAELARLVGPLAAAHRLASVALELSELAEKEGRV